MLKFIGFHRRLALLNCGIILFVTLFALATPALFKVIVEGVLPDQNYRSFYIAAAALGFVTVGRTFFGVVQDYVFLLHRQLIEADAVALALQRDDLKFLNMASAFSNIRNFIASFQYFWIEFVFYLAYAVFISIVVLIAFFLIEPVYFWLALVFMGLHAANFLAFKPRFDRLAARFNRDKTDMLTELSTHLRLLKEIKASGREAFLTRRMTAFARAYALSYSRKEFLNFLQQLLQNSLINVFYIGFFCAALYLSVARNTSIGSAALCIFLSNFLFEPIYRFNAIVKAFFEASSYTAWVPHARRKKPQAAVRTEGAVLTLDGVLTQPMQVRGLSPLRIAFAPGRLYLIKGPSGSGKSTLLDCIAGLDKPVAGRIRFGESERVKSAVYYCEQNAAVFPGTLLENLTFYAPTSDSAAVHRALSAANLTQVYLANEHGTDPSQLSGGQKQRLSVARSFYCGENIVLYDEPTSALDSDNERHVLAYLARLAREKLVILVSHSPAAEHFADAVLDLSSDEAVARFA